jgi:hypothetical protein
MAMLLYADKQFTSPYAMSAFVALKEKQIPFEVRTLDLAIGANNDPEYARTSLTQHVPTHAATIVRSPKADLDGGFVAFRHVARGWCVRTCSTERRQSPHFRAVPAK